MHTIAGTGLALVLFSMFSSHGATMVVGLGSHANDSHKQTSVLVMKAIEGIGKHFPTTWSASKSNQLTKENSEFLNSFESADSSMLWRGYDIRLNSPAAIHYSILNNPFFNLNENITSSGSLSASGKLIISAKNKKNRGTLDYTGSAKPPVEDTKRSSLIKDGKIDMDLILIISASMGGLILILIPERKRKRDQIKEVNLALLRRPKR